MAEHRAHLKALEAAVSQSGSADDLVALATAYSNAEEDAKAIEVLERAVSLGHLGAHVLLANYCIRNEDGARAVSLLAQASDRGHADASCSLGCALHVGNGAIAKDESRAFVYLLRAAEQGDATAMFMVGSSLFDGAGVEEDVVAAHQWYERAHAAGDTHSAVELIKDYYFGRGVPEDHARAMVIGNQAINNPNVDAKVFAALGRIYGGQGDWKTAVRLFKRGAARGDGWSTAELAYCYRNGEGVQRDAKLARELSAKAERLGFVPDEEE